VSAKVVVIVALVLLALGFGGGWYVRGQGAQADLAEARRDRAADQAGVALATAQAEDAQRRHEQNQAAGIASAAES